MAAVGNVGRVPRSVADATHELYRQYGKQIYAYCLHQLRSREEAEDAVQTTFLNAFRGLQRGTTTRFEQAWLYKIAQNVCIARRSSSGRRLKLEAPDDFEVLQEVVPSGASGGDSDTLELMGLDSALDSMPENQRRAILLREWQGLSYREIATELGLSQGAVEMLIFRARRTLAQALEQPDVAEKRTKSSRMKTGFSFGSLIAAMKSLLTGGVALKMAAVAVGAAVVGTNAVHTVVHRALVMHPRPHRAALAAPAPHVASRRFVAYRTSPARTASAPAVAAPAPPGGPPETSSPGHEPVLVEDVASTPAPVTTPVASPPADVPPAPPPAPDSSGAPPASSPPPVVATGGGDSGNHPAPPSKAPAAQVAPPTPTGGPGADGSPAGPAHGGPGGDGAHQGDHGDHGHGKSHGGNGGGQPTAAGPVEPPYPTLAAAPTTTTTETTTTTVDTATTTTTTTAATPTPTTLPTPPTTTTDGGSSPSPAGDQGGPHHGDGGNNGNGGNDGGGHGRHGH